MPKSHTSLTTDQIKDNAITNAEVASDAAIDISKLDPSVASKDYVDNAVSAVSGGTIADGSVTNAKIAAGAAIDISKLDSNVASKSYVDTAVTLDNVSITTGAGGIQVASAGVTTDKIADGAINDYKISSTAFGGGISGGSGAAISIRMFMGTPSGDVDGNNAVFVLPEVPHMQQLFLFRNGVFQAAGALMDYTLATDVITFNNAPGINDVIMAAFFY